MAHVSNSRARVLSGRKVGTYVFEGIEYDLTWNETAVLVYDDLDVAVRMAKHLGTDATHNGIVGQPDKSISLVHLP